MVHEVSKENHMDTLVWIDIDPLLNTSQEASPPDQTPKSLESPLKYSDLRDDLMEDGLKDESMAWEVVVECARVKARFEKEIRDTVRSAPCKT
jgi:hypothetical protein